VFEKWIEDNRAAFIEDTKQLLRIRSVKELPSSPERPFGDGPAAALDYMLNLGRRYGFETSSIGGFAGHIEWGTGDQYVAVLAHLDVVPEGTDWTYPPYGAHMENGRIYARGAIDDKGPAMAALYAMRALAAQSNPLTHRVRLILGLDEESGWRCMDEYFAKEPQPVCGFTPDASFPIIFAEKGIMDFSLTISKGIQGSGWRLKELIGGERPNMVPDRCTAIIETSPHFASDLCVVWQNRMESFCSNTDIQVRSESELKVTIRGVSAHGSRPQSGENAVVRMYSFLKNVGQANESDWINLLSEFRTDGGDLGIACKDEVTGALTCNLGMVSLQDHQQQIVCNVRYPIDRNASDLVRQVSDSVKKLGVSVTLLDDKRPLHVSKDDPLIQTLARAYEDVTGNPATLLTIGGGTYARAIDKGVAFGAQFPGQPDLAHQCDEYVVVDNLIKCIEIYSRALHELAK